jgi:hypothetical protein
MTTPLLHISYLISSCHSLLLPTLWWQCPFKELTKNMKYGEGALSSESWKK